MGDAIAIKKAKELGVKNPVRLSYIALIRTIQEWRESCLAG
jgi:hypothetical protein